MFKNIDWWTVVCYFMLVLVGWLSINAATFTFDDRSIVELLFDFSHQSGKQVIWFGVAVVVAIVILSLDVKYFTDYAPVIYIAVMILLGMTIFIGTNINGSHSWIHLYGNTMLQPAEFGKFSTALMLAWLFHNHDFDFSQPKYFFQCCLVVLLPVLLIIAQKETGSALVYFSLVLLFYRQGMSGIILWAGFCAILIFVLAVKYGVEPLPEGVILRRGEQLPPSHFGQSLVLTIIPLLTAAMLAFYAHCYMPALAVVGGTLSLCGVAGFLVRYVSLPFHFEYRWCALCACGLTVVYCLWLLLSRQNRRCLHVMLLALAFIAFLYSVDYAFHNVLQPHQRGRIEILLGMREDPQGDGYNVNQAKIAIGSGGFWGKGYLQGTQTKLAYVPEQETDFIFCTIGEEAGFWGTSLTLLLYLILIARLIYLAERQRDRSSQEVPFGLIFGYCVACVVAFHVIINVGMVIGLMPVIGIPLPLVSYGGSSLLSFTIQIFIMLKLDSERRPNYSSPH